MPIALQTPIAQAPITNITVLDFRVHFGNAQNYPSVTYVASDANDNPIAGAAPVMALLTAADMLVFYSTAGGTKPRAIAALINNQPQLTGPIT